MINPQKPDSIIENIFNSLNESRSVEFKPSIPWPQNRNDFQKAFKAEEIAKSILGMTNSRDGGKIILGVEIDATTKRYVLKGMAAKDLPSYDQDDIFQQIRNFGKPEPRFQVVNVEQGGMNFIVFAVQPFILAPSICNNSWNLPNFEPGVIYIRGDKPETKKISDPIEMKELIDIVVDRELEGFSGRVQKLFGTARPVAPQTKTDQAKFEDELKDLKS